MLALALVGIGALLFAGSAGASRREVRAYSTTLSSGEEARETGEGDAGGFVTITLDPRRRQICYQITVSGIGPGAEAHIHEATSGQDGPAIIGLKLLPDGSTSGCVRATRSLIYKISRNPSDYYVHVQNSERPHGALRGQI
ncbi:MAG: CHRD domain-containing protein [Rubrobacteraceae bacterium]